LFVAASLTQASGVFLTRWLNCSPWDERQIANALRERDILKLGLFSEYYYESYFIFGIDFSL
jgi:hypothetical protein